MDPLTIGFENAFHEANATPPSDPEAAARLVDALRAVLDASPHRAAAVTVSAIDASHVEIRRGDRAYVLENESGRWRLRGSRDPAWSGPVAAALTEWLTR